MKYFFSLLHASQQLEASFDTLFPPSFQQSFEATAVGEKVPLLFLALTTEAANCGEDGRQLAAVMLRRIVTGEFDDFFPKLPVEQQAQFKVRERRKRKGAKKWKSIRLGTMKLICSF